MPAVGSQYFISNTFAVDLNGVPLAAGQLFFFHTQTSAPALVYTSPALTTLYPVNDNGAIEADANGYFGAIWLSPTTAYKVALWTAATPDNPTGSQIWTEDPIGPAAGGVISNTAGIIGEVRDYAGLAASVPAGWYLCYGQAVSRTTYSSLYSVIGTLWGIGDGSTTFNLPDFRGRAAFGKDDMGGTPASRLTAGVSGVGANAVGGVGGDQRVQTHTHVPNDPGHNHVDPGHDHSTVAPANQPSAADGTNNKLVTATGGSTGMAFTGIEDATTGITNNNYGAGSSQNVPPAAVVNKIIYAGV